MSDWQKFPKITRYLNIEFTITEKIDGTNAAIEFEQGGFLVNAYSRTRPITPADDNYGFARWVYDNTEELYEFFGPGLHFGEWWGSGIQKRYGAYLPKGQKFFSPFNVKRFNGSTEGWPEGCIPVVILDTHVMMRDVPQAVEDWSNQMLSTGSFQVPGAKAEGIMLYSDATGYIKHPFDDGHKWTRGESSV